MSRAVSGNFAPMGRSELNAAIYEALDDLLVDESAGALDAAPFKMLYLIRDAAELANQLSSVDLDEADFSFLEAQAGLIVIEQPGGHYHVRYYDNEDRLEDRWEDLRNDLDERESDGFAAGDDIDDDDDNDDAEAEEEA